MSRDSSDPSKPPTNMSQVDNDVADVAKVLMSDYITGTKCIYIYHSYGTTSLKHLAVLNANPSTLPTFPPPYSYAQYSTYSSMYFCICLSYLRSCVVWWLNLASQVTNKCLIAHLVSPSLKCVLLPCMHDCMLP